MIKLNILGTEYEFKHNTELCRCREIDGMCRQYSKEMVVRELGDMLDPDEDKDAKERRYKEVCRHEVLHAFFGEAGLERYNADEALIVFLSVNFPKMAKVFNEHGWLDE